MIFFLKNYRFFLGIWLGHLHRKSLERIIVEIFFCIGFDLSSFPVVSGQKLDRAEKLFFCPSSFGKTRDAPPFLSFPRYAFSYNNKWPLGRGKRWQRRKKQEENDKVKQEGYLVLTKNPIVILMEDALSVFVGNDDQNLGGGNAWADQKYLSCWQGTRNINPRTSFFHLLQVFRSRISAAKWAARKLKLREYMNLSLN